MSRRYDWINYWAERGFEGYFDAYREAKAIERAQDEAAFRAYQRQEEHEAWERQRRREREEDEERRQRERDAYQERDVDREGDAYEEPWQYYDDESGPYLQPNRARKFLVHKVLSYGERHRQTRRKLRGGPERPRPLLLTDGREKSSRGR